jgi:type I restriction enzyme S subunit
MNKVNNSPEIRFNGFDKQWNQKVLNNISNIIGGGTPSTAIPEFWGGNIDWYSPTEIGKQTYANNSIKKITELGFKNSSTQFLPPHKTILFTSRAGIGDMAILTKKATTNQGFQSLVVLDENDTYFIYSSGHLIKDYALKHSSGSTFLEISGKQLGKMVLNIPSFPEQQKIGTYFKQIDQLITLKQKKHTKLLNLKKAMLNKMFPQNGASTPEIRFKGFDGEWEEKCLGEVTTQYSGGTPSITFKEYYGGIIPFIRSGDIKSKSTQLFLTNLGLEKSSAKLVKKGDVLYALYGATSGEVGISKINGAINQAILAINPKSGYSNNFLAQYLSKEKNNIVSTYLQGGQGNLSGSIVSELKVLFPKDYLEQTKIGNYFKKLDHLISLQEKEITKLKNIKKALLEKMFV